tara:strand:- start:269 stop:430 length:162 start_codon:yes stop_codon:yes gene_type:complete
VTSKFKKLYTPDLGAVVITMQSPLAVVFAALLLFASVSVFGSHDFFDFGDYNF